MDPINEQNLYRIGTVASLTGISVERLRAWERRYDMSPAHKAGKTRFYSKPQLDRLKLIKHLIDQGQPISSLAGLSFAQLQARIEEDQGAAIVVAAHTPKVGLVGPNLLMLEQQAQQGSVRLRIHVVSRWANFEAFETEQTGTDNPQVMILQLPVLSYQPIELTKEIYPEAEIIVVYQFATSKVISNIQSNGVPTMKWPISWSELEHVTATTIGLTNRPGKFTSRQYSDEELIAIAASSEDSTQCPQYLIEAIHQLNAFTQYAEDCSHSVDRPKIYHRLQADASQARGQLEMALESLLEGIEASS